MNGSRRESKRWSATSAAAHPLDGLDRSRPAAGGKHFRMACFVMHHTVVLSDIHLCEVEPESGLWMRYRQRAYLPDPELAAMLGALRERVGSDGLTLVLNGDVFDFDAPRVIGRESVFHDLPRTPENSVSAMIAILDDHPLF